MNFQRTMVIGSPGSGKTTFSLELSKLIDKKPIHLDAVLWEKNWTMPTAEKRVEIHNNIIASNSWLVDGMWKSLVVDRLNRATAVIFLDYKRHVSFFRAVKRFFKYRKKQRADVAVDCFEKLDKEFLSYIWNFNRDVRPFLLSALEGKSGEIDVVIFKTPKQAKQFLAKLQREM